ncbi:MAG TPA: MBL fold metallo-hydrolase [Holophagaceae bacterium]|nr:MBL fold metallo-hydrolase [Holophagaceae bacterium]
MGEARSIPQPVGEGIWRVVNRRFQSNSYICATGEPGRCFLVDPGTDPEGIDAALGELGLEPRLIFCTHGHFDHAGSAAFFQRKYGAPCHLHPADQKTLKGSNFLLMAFKIPYTMALPETREAEAFIEALGLPEVRIFPAPGHTPGSCILQVGRALFTGDTLYSYGVGLSMLPGEDTELLKATLRGLWDRLPETGTIYPGHGDASPFAGLRERNLPLRAFLGLDAPTRGNA